MAPRRFRGLAAELAALLTTTTVLVGLPLAQPAAAATCTSSGPGGYSVSVCLTDPPDGATLTGGSTVTATFTVSGGTSPGASKLEFFLDDAHLLTDYESPYTFTLPTASMTDGPVVLGVEANMRDGFTTSRTTVSVTLSNGNATTPPAPTGFTPTSGTTPPAGRPFVLAATGDGASGQSSSDAVAAGLAALDPNLFLYLGDVYEKGTYTEYVNWYGESDRFGALKNVTNPVLGNHEQSGGQWPGHDRYWASPPVNYSFDAGGWHVVVLELKDGPTPALTSWLADDLAASTAPCTIATFHHPVLSVGPQGNSTGLYPLWAQLVDAGVDLVLTAHDHSYQRWVPLDRDLAPDPAGVTQFVVGGGGHGIQAFTRTDSRLAVGADTPPLAFGALRMELNQHGAAFGYVNTADTLLDSGTVQCSGTPADVTAPTSPTDVSATAVSGMQVDLTWTASTDNVGVTEYTVLRDGSPVGTVSGTERSFTDSTVAPSTTYSYTVAAADAAGNSSGPSAPDVVLTPDPPTELTFVAVADSWVDASAPTTNFGSAADLRVDASPDRRAYLRFNVSGVTQGVTSATLRVHANSTHAKGFEAQSVSDNGWPESAVTYDNAPAFGPVLGASGPTTSGAYSEVDVTGHVTGDGLHSFALTALSSTSLPLASRESTTPPELVLTQGTPVNAPPAADDVSATTVADTPATIALAATDPDGDCPLTFAVDTPPTHGTVGAVSAEQCSGGAATAEVTYTPDPGYTGPDSLTYTATDPDGATSTPATVSVTVDPAPTEVTVTTVADSWVDASAPSTNYGTRTTMRVDGSPVRRGFVRFSVAGVTGPVTSATLRIRSASTHSGGFQVRTVADTTWGETTITDENAPPTGALLGASGPLTNGSYVEVDVTAEVTGNGQYSLALTPTNSTSLSLSTRETSTPPELVVTQDTSGNSRPTAEDVSLSTDEDTTGTWTPSVFDPDPDVLVCTIASPPSHGSASVASDCSGGDYTPDPDHDGADSFTYQVSDGSLTDTAEVAVTVLAVNDAPTADDRSATTAAGTPVTVTLTGSDRDGDCPLTFAVDTPPAHGTVGAVSDEQCAGGSGTAEITYTPDPGYTGPDSLTYTVTDPGAAASATATVAITVEPPQTGFTFAASADTWVDASAPTTNYGTRRTMRLDTSPERRAYVRVDASGLTGTVTSAVLRVRANSTHSAGFRVRDVTDDLWSETAVVFTGAPAVGALLGSSGPTTNGAYVEVDVTSVVTGNGSHSFALVPVNSTNLPLSTRESSTPPELVVVVAP